MSFVFKQTRAVLSSSEEKGTRSKLRHIYLRRGGRDTSYFQRTHSARSPQIQWCLEAKWGVNKFLMRTYSEERRQVTIIYFEISRLIVPDESKGKWRVKAGNGEFGIERNQDAGAFEEPLVRVTETETRSG